MSLEVCLASASLDEFGGNLLNQWLTMATAEAFSVMVLLLLSGGAMMIVDGGMLSCWPYYLYYGVGFWTKLEEN